MNITELIQQTSNADCDKYTSLIGDSIRQLTLEKKQTNNLEISGKLIQIESYEELVIVGDLHGDLNSLVHILESSKFLEKITRNTGIYLIFLGDYVDRGPNSPEVLYAVLKLKQCFPNNVMLLRGNHEGPDDLMPYPHDLPQALNSKFSMEGKTIYRKIRKLFTHLYNAVVIQNFCVLVHGGVPSQANSIEDLKFAHLTHPKTSHLEELLWSDPIENKNGIINSPRGAGKLFGEDITEKFLQVTNVKCVIRGHEPVNEGYKINHNGKILTLFSRKGSPYFNPLATYLHFNFSSTINTAYDLIPFLKKF